MGCKYFTTIHASGEVGLGVKVVNGKVILHSLNYMSYGLKVQSNGENLALNSSASVLALHP